MHLIIDLAEVYGLVAGGGQHDGLAAVEVHVVDGAVVAGQLVQHAPRRRVPDVQEAVRRARGHLPG